MAGTFADLGARLTLSIQDFAQNMGKASGMANKFASSLNGKVYSNLTEPATKAGSAFKDVARIVQGILISQIFYRGVNAIRAAVTAVYDFKTALESAQIVYAKMFNGQISLSKEFVNVLQDFAAITPFTFQQASDAARQLLAYGIQAENVMYILQAVNDAAAATGDPTKVEAISRALGQIHTKGRLMQQELLQLTEAGIPAFDILKDELGLTAKEIQNIGRQGIDSNTAINALVEGISKRYGGLSDAISQTVIGLTSTIKDNLLIIAGEVFDPMYQSWRSFLYKVSTELNVWREIVAEQGLGGLFEHIVPPELQSTVRQLFANVMNLGRAFAEMGRQLWPIISQFLVQLTQLLNVLIPIITGLISSITNVIRSIAGSEQGMRNLSNAILLAIGAILAFKAVSAMSGAATAITSAIGAISRAFGTLTAAASRSIAATVAFFAIAAAVLALGAAVAKTNNVFGRLMNIFTGKNQGVNKDNLLIPDQKERLSDIDKFNDKMGGSGGAKDKIEDVGDAAKGAGKKAKLAALAFDELYQLNKPDEDSGSAGDVDIGDIGVGDIDPIDLSELMPDPAEFSIFSEDFWSNVTAGLKEALPGMAWGALAGGIIGFLIGGIPGALAGAGIGAAVGGIVSYFWDELQAEFGLTMNNAIGVGVGAVSGAILGSIVGGPIGAAIGAIVGAIAGYFVGELENKFHDKLSQLRLITNKKEFKDLAPGLGKSVVEALVDEFNKTGEGGVTLFIGIDFFKGLLDYLRDNNVTKLKSDMEKSTLPKDVKEALFGPLLNYLQGATPWETLNVTTAFSKIKEGWFGGIWQIFTDAANSEKPPATAGQAFAKLFAKAVDDAGNEDPASKTNLGGTIKNMVGGFFTAFSESFTAGIGLMKQKIDETYLSVSTAIGGFFSKIGTGISTFFSTAWTNISNAFSLIGTKLSEFFAPVTEFFGTIFETIGGVFSKIGELIGTVFEGIWFNVSTWFQNIWNTVTEKVSGIWTTVSTWFQNIWNTVTTKVSGVWNTVSTWFQNIWNTVTTKVSGVWSTISTKFQEIWDTIGTKLSGAFDTVGKWFQDIWDKITEKTGNAFTTVKNWATDIKDKASGWVQEAYDTISTKFGDLWEGFKTWTKNIFDTINNWARDVKDAIFGWFDQAIAKLREFFGLSAQANTPSGKPAGNSTGSTLGHATGGVFNKEHLARFAEGNREEVTIPLQNSRYMAPFVDYIADGISRRIGSQQPVTGTFGNGDTSPTILYIGTLVADEQGLKQLERKLNIIRTKENVRKNGAGV